MAVLLFGLPFLAGLAAFTRMPRNIRRGLYAAVVAAHLVLTLAAGANLRPLAGWVGLDAAGWVFLLITSVLFVIVSISILGGMSWSGGKDEREVSEGWISRDPESVLLACLLMFLSTMSLAAVSRHLGLLWVAVEGTTLSTAPLIYYHRSPRSLEATWKYLVVCSVGIAVALLGNFCLSAASGGEVHLSIEQLQGNAGILKPVWLRGAFIFFLVGYGAKMGLAPMHSWLPDAHSEAPSPVSALLSGALLNCAYLAILRCHGILDAAGQGAFSAELLVMFGLISLAVAAIFLIEQGDYKRMLAYSSVEHMGILSLGAGLGAGFGVMLQALNHSLLKGALFLTSGIILSRRGVKTVKGACGLIRDAPLTASLWLAGFLALTGLPPFGAFFAKMEILRSSLSQKHWIAAGVFLLATAVIFAAMSRSVMHMIWEPRESEADPAPVRGETFWAIMPPLLLLLLSLGLGVLMPDRFIELLHTAAREVGLQ